MAENRKRGDGDKFEICFALALIDASDYGDMNGSSSADMDLDASGSQDGLNQPLRGVLPELEKQVEDIARLRQIQTEAVNASKSATVDSSVNNISEHFTPEPAQPAQPPGPSTLNTPTAAALDDLVRLITEEGLSASTVLPTAQGITPNTFAHAAPPAFPSIMATLPHAFLPRPPRSPDAVFDFDFGLLDTTMMDLSEGLDARNTIETGEIRHGLETDTDSPSWTEYFETMTARNIPSDTPVAGPSAANPLLGVTMTARGLPSDTPPALNSAASSLLGLQQVEPFTVTKLPGRSWRLQASNKEWDSGHSATLDQRQNTVSSSWFDPQDVPPAVRDHLLDLYFSRDGIFHPMLNIARFYARLTLPPAKRPHPALLYTMYLSGVRASTQPALRSLEGRFYEIAQSKIYQGLREADRLLDLVRALTLMTGYLFANEWYNLGYNMAGSTARLAIACGLHRLPSSVYSPPPLVNPAVYISLRMGGYALDPPEDAVELGERINTFWAVFEVDQCTFIAYMWDPIFRMDGVLTPLPRPLEDYACGLVSTADDVRIASVMDEHAPPLSNDTYFMSLRMRALSILATAVQLRDAGDPSVTRYGALKPPSPKVHSPGRYASAGWSAFEANPEQFFKVKKAADKYCRELPGCHKLPWDAWDSGEYAPGPFTRGLGQETAVLWFIIGNAYIHLWNVSSLASENVKAVLVARRMASIMLLYAGGATGPRPERRAVHPPTGQVISEYTAFLVCIWNEVKMILLRELKRLETLDRWPEAASYGTQLDELAEALKDWKISTSAEVYSSLDFTSVNDRLISQLRAMSVETWRQAMAAGEGSG